MAASPSYTILLVTPVPVGRASSRRWQERLSAALGRRCPWCALVLSLCLISAACAGGGTAKHRSVAARVCAHAQQAARPLLGASVTLRIASSAPTYIECVLEGRGIQVDAIAQATAVAWTEYDTATVHQAQAYGGAGLHQPGQLPHPVPGMDGNSTWIPAKQELLATNGTEFRGGSYLTVTIIRRSPHGPAGVAVAAAVGRAVLASAPRGPNPGAPPS
jgi:hypothetical protein